MGGNQSGPEQPQVYWIGGSPCAGKSSIADILVARYGLQSYRCDEFFGEHMGQASPDCQPTLHQLACMTWDEIWMQPIEVLLKREIEAYREEFAFIQADIAKLVGTGERPVLAEGAALMPDLVAARLSSPHHGIWIVPNETFQRSQYPKRPWIQEILEGCSDPEGAFQNWMDRDVAYAAWIRERAVVLGLEVIIIDGSRSIEDNVAIVAHHFHLKE